MQKETKAKVSKIYRICLTVYVGLLTAAFLAALGFLYFTKDSREQAFTYELFGDTFLYLLAPIIILVVAIVVAKVLGLFNPNERTLVKRDETTMVLKAKRENIITYLDENDEDGSLRQQLKKYFILKIAIISVAIIISIVCLVFSLIYCFRQESLDIENNTVIGANLNLFATVLPFIAIAFIWVIVTAFVINLLSKFELQIMKEHKVYKAKAHVSKLERIYSTPAFVWSLRIVIIALSITFIILGIFNNGASDVLSKAIKICTECIGLG